MDIKDHGVWHQYRPAKLPENAPSGAMFARREGDGVDWYDYVNSGKNFRDGSVKLTVLNNVVMAAVNDPTLLFPDNATVLEITDVSIHNPQEAFGRKIYDARQQTFQDPEPFEMADPLTKILQRLEALEEKQRGGMAGDAD